MKLPIKALKELANKFGYSVVIVYAYDAENNMQHVATWGRTIKLCDQAAQLGNMMKDALGWPASLHAEPNRVKKLQERIKELEKLEGAVKEHFQVTQIPTSMLRRTERAMLDLINRDLCICLHPGQLTEDNICQKCGLPFFRTADDDS